MKFCMEYKKMDIHATQNFHEIYATKMFHGIHATFFWRTVLTRIVDAAIILGFGIFILNLKNVHLFNKKNILKNKAKMLTKQITRLL